MANFPNRANAYNNIINGAGSPSDNNMKSLPGTVNCDQTKARKNNEALSFPEKIHFALSHEECKDAIAWLPAGQAFCITNKDKFENFVLPNYINHDKSKTSIQKFEARLRKWGFKKHIIDIFIFTHQYFTQHTRARAELKDGDDFYDFMKKLRVVLDSDKCTPFISWLPSGKAFSINDKVQFEKTVLVKFFGGMQFSAFTNNLKSRRFQKIDVCEYVGNWVYSHGMFLEDRPELCPSISYRGSPLNVRKSPFADEKAKQNFGPLDLAFTASKTLEGIMLHKTTNPNNYTSGLSTKKNVLHPKLLQCPQQSQNSSSTVHPREDSLQQPAVSIAARHSTPLTQHQIDQNGKKRTLDSSLSMKATGDKSNPIIISSTEETAADINNHDKFLMSKKAKLLVTKTSPHALVRTDINAQPHQDLCDEQNGVSLLLNMKRCSQQSQDFSKSAINAQETLPQTAVPTASPHPMPLPQQQVNQNGEEGTLESSTLGTKLPSGGKLFQAPDSEATIKDIKSELLDIDTELLMLQAARSALLAHSNTTPRTNSNAQPCQGLCTERNGASFLLKQQQQQLPQQNQDYRESFSNDQGTLQQTSVPNAAHHPMRFLQQKVNQKDDEGTLEPSLLGIGYARGDNANQVLNSVETAQDIKSELLSIDRELLALKTARSKLSSQTAHSDTTLLTNSNTQPPQGLYTDRNGASLQLKQQQQQCHQQFQDYNKSFSTDQGTLQRTAVPNAASNPVSLLQQQVYQNAEGGTLDSSLLGIEHARDNKTNQVQHYEERHEDDELELLNIDRQLLRLKVAKSRLVSKMTPSNIMLRNDPNSRYIQGLYTNQNGPSLLKQQQQCPQQFQGYPKSFSHSQGILQQTAAPTAASHPMSVLQHQENQNGEEEGESNQSGDIRSQILNLRGEILMLKSARLFAMQNSLKRQLERKEKK